MPDREVRVTSETGGQKGMKLEQLGGIDPSALREVARVAGMGAVKYERYNYLRGYDWSLSFDAMQRHLLAWWSGEDIDRCTTEGHPIEPHDYTPDCNGSGLSHLGHAAWHALALLAFQQRQVGTDNRPPRVDKPPVDVVRDILRQLHDGEITSYVAAAALGITLP